MDRKVVSTGLGMGLICWSRGAAREGAQRRSRRARGYRRGGSRDAAPLDVTEDTIAWEGRRTPPRTPASPMNDTTPGDTAETGAEASPPGPQLVV